MRERAWEAPERAVAKRRGGVRNPGSGSGWRRRNDVREAHVLWEMKTTGAKSLTVKDIDLEILRRHAITDGKMPAFCFQVGDGRRWVAITEEDFDAAFPPE